MCELCGTDEEKKAGRDQARRTAEMLRRVSKDYHDMADGHLNPHSEEAASAAIRARAAIRVLVQEYV